MSSVSKRRKENDRNRFKTMGNHDDFLRRITKSLYYGKLPTTERLSYPVTELATELFSEAQYNYSLDRLHFENAASISRNACVSPCSFVLAVLYLERLKACNPEYLHKIAPSELFLVSLMVSSKFLHDDGEDDEVFTDEWASSGGISIKDLVRLEKEFLSAIHWEVFVNKSTFWKKLSHLELTIALRQGQSRGGWFTYADLKSLLDVIEVYNLVQSLITVTTVILASYTASFLTIIGSAMIVSQIPGSALYKHTNLQEKCTEAKGNICYLKSENYDSRLLIENDTDYNFVLNDIYGFQKEIEKSTSLTKENNLLRNINSLDPVNVLTTSFIFASLQTISKSYTYSMPHKSLKSPETSNSVWNENRTFIDWDWWTNDVMNWIYKISVQNELTEQLHSKLEDSKCFDYGKRIDMTIANCKLLYLEDQIHKATSIRIQDQIESSWHVEWIDSSRNIFIKTK